MTLDELLKQMVEGLNPQLSDLLDKTMWDTLAKVSPKVDELFAKDKITEAAAITLMCHAVYFAKRVEARPDDYFFRALDVVYGPGAKP